MIEITNPQDGERLKKLIVLHDGICDFYEINLRKQPQTTVVISIRATLGAVKVLVLCVLLFVYLFFSLF